MMGRIQRLRSRDVHCANLNPVPAVLCPGIPFLTFRSMSGQTEKRSCSVAHSGSCKAEEKLTNGHDTGAGTAV